MWRVALLFWFLKRAADLPSYAVVIGSLLPLALIVTALTVLNLEHVMFDQDGLFLLPEAGVLSILRLRAYHAPLTLSVAAERPPALRSGRTA